MRGALWPSSDHGAEVAAYFAGLRVYPAVVMVAVEETSGGGGGAVMGHVEMSVRVDEAGVR